MHGGIIDVSGDQDLSSAKARGPQRWVAHGAA
jgi:hypothetical protein